MEDENITTEEEIIEEEGAPVEDDGAESGRYDRLLERDARKFKLSGMFKDWYLDYINRFVRCDSGQ